MQKAHKFIPQSAARKEQQGGKPTTSRTLPKPLDAAAQRLVGGGTGSPGLPVKGW